MTRWLRPAIASLALLVGLGLPSAAQARRVRPLFEPTDLELEQPGMLDLDLQFGPVRSRGPARAVLPDFELDLGLLPNLEFDIDGSYAIEGPAQGSFSFDHPAPDNLWPALKLGLFDARDPAAGTAFAVGVQVGPKLPVGVGTHGVGVEALALVGTTWSTMQLVWNAGMFVDPDPDSAPGRPIGLEVGVDAELSLDQHFALEANVSAVRFVSPDADQLVVGCGATWSVSDVLDLSLSTFVGLLNGSDRYGVLLGVSPKFRLWRSD